MADVFRSIIAGTRNISHICKHLRAHSLCMLLTLGMLQLAPAGIPNSTYARSGRCGLSSGTKASSTRRLRTTL